VNRKMKLLEVEIEIANDIKKEELLDGYAETIHFHVDKQQASVDEVRQDLVEFVTDWEGVEP